MDNFGTLFNSYCSGFATTHVVVPVICNEKLCFENILYISDANERQNQVHAFFLLMVQQIWMFFSLKPSLSQGESSLAGVRRFGGVREQTNTPTH